MSREPVPTISSWAKQLQEHEYKRHRFRLAGKGAESDEHAAKLDALLKLPGFEPLSEWVKNSSRHVLRPLALKAAVDHVKAEASRSGYVQAAIYEMRKLKEMESEVERIADARHPVFAKFQDLSTNMDRVRTRAQIKRHEEELHRMELELNAMDKKRAQLENEIQAAGKSNKALQTCRPILEALWFLMNLERATEYRVARSIEDAVVYFELERENAQEDVKDMKPYEILAFSAASDVGTNIDAILIPLRFNRWVTVYPPQESILLKVDQDVSAAAFVRQWIQKLPQENATPDWYVILGQTRAEFTIFTPSSRTTITVPDVGDRESEQLGGSLPLQASRGSVIASAFNTNGGGLQTMIKKITPDVTIILDGAANTASSAIASLITAGGRDFRFLRYPPPTGVLPLLDMEAMLPKLREEKKATEPRNETDPYAVAANSTPLLAFQQATTRLYEMTPEELKKEQKLQMARDGGLGVLAVDHKHPFTIHVCWVKYPVVSKSAGPDRKDVVVAEPFPILIVISALQMYGVHMQLVKPLLSAPATFTCMYVSVEPTTPEDKSKSLCTTYTNAELLAARSFPQQVVQFASAKWTPCSGWGGSVHFISGDGGCTELIATPNAKIGSTFVLLAKSLASLFDVDYLTLEDAATVNCPAWGPGARDMDSFKLRVGYVLQKGMPWYSEFGFMPKEGITAIKFITDVFSTTTWSVFHAACVKALSAIIAKQSTDDDDYRAARLALESINLVGCGGNSQQCTVKQTVSKSSQAICGSFAEFTKVMSDEAFVAELIRQLDKATPDPAKKIYVREYDLHAPEIANYFSPLLREMIWFRRLTGVLPPPTTASSPSSSPSPMLATKVAGHFYASASARASAPSAPMPCFAVAAKVAGWHRPMFPSVPARPVWRLRPPPPVQRVASRPVRFSFWQQ